MSVANRLVESGHYASQQIKQIANQLEQEWKAFAAALDERSTLLDMSSIFHQKAEKVSARHRVGQPAASLAPPGCGQILGGLCVAPNHLSSADGQLAYPSLCNLRQVV